MPISSSSEPPQQAVLQFVGPSSTESSLKTSSWFRGSNSLDAGNIIYLRDPCTGALNPAFSVQFSRSKPNVTLSKLLPDGSMRVIGTSERSEVSGKYTLILQGQEAEMGYNSWGTKRLSIPSIGEFKMESGLSGSSIKFIDSQKTRIAKCSWSEAEPTIEIYVQCASDLLIEMLVLGGVALAYSAKKDAKATKVGLEVVQALAGGIPGSGS